VYATLQLPEWRSHVSGENAPFPVEEKLTLPAKVTVVPWPASTTLAEQLSGEFTVVEALPQVIVVKEALALICRLNPEAVDGEWSVFPSYLPPICCEPVLPGATV
jgi:hypothetical protein